MMKVALSRSLQLRSSVRVLRFFSAENSNAGNPNVDELMKKFHLPGNRKLKEDLQKIYGSTGPYEIHPDVLESIKTELELDQLTNEYGSLDEDSTRNKVPGDLGEDLERITNIKTAGEYMRELASIKSGREPDPNEYKDFDDVPFDELMRMYADSMYEEEDADDYFEGFNDEWYENEEDVQQEADKRKK
jgi:hypothetical protein